MSTLPQKNARRVGLKSAEDVRRFITSLINKIVAGGISREDARACGYLCGLILECLKFKRESELEKRLAELEHLAGIDEDQNHDN